LNGSGEDLVRENGNWGRYMMDNTLLPPQLVAQLEKDAKARKASGPVNITFHAEIENGYLTGYEMLHGTHRGEGDFQIRGKATVAPATGGQKIHYELRYSWNDRIDKNAQYAGDNLFAGILRFFYDPKDYAIHIHWDAPSDVTVCNGKITESSGYPWDKVKK